MVVLGKKKTSLPCSSWKVSYNKRLAMLIITQFSWWFQFDFPCINNMVTNAEHKCLTEWNCRKNCQNKLDFPHEKLIGSSIYGLHQSTTNCLLLQYYWLMIQFAMCQMQLWNVAMQNCFRIEAWKLHFFIGLTLSAIACLCPIEPTLILLLL